MTKKDKHTLQSLFSVFANRKHLLIPETPQDLKLLPSYFPSFPISFATVSGTQMYHDSDGFKAHYEFMNLLMSQREFSRYYDGGSISGIVKKHTTNYLEDLAANRATNKSIDQTIEQILSDLEVIPDEAEYIFLINGLRLKNLSSFSLGRATFRKIDEPYAQKLFPPRANQPENSNDTPPKRTSSLIGRTAIGVRIRGVSRRAQQIAYREAQISIGALAIYPIIFNFESASPQLFRWTISGLSRQGFGPVVSFDTNTQGRTIWQGGFVSGVPLDLEQTDIEKFKNYGWSDVSKFLEDRDDSKEIDRGIENSLFWIGQAAGGNVLAGILLNYFTAIETLIIGRKKTNTIVQDLARRLPILVGHTDDERKRIVKELKKTGGSYDLRGEITHSGVSEIEDKKKIFDTGALAAWTVLRFLKARGFRSLDQAIESLDIAARSIDKVPKESLNWKLLATQGKKLLRYFTGAK